LINWSPEFFSRDKIKKSSISALDVDVFLFIELFEGTLTKEIDIEKKKKLTIKLYL
jgi:hypothetical protein